MGQAESTSERERRPRLGPLWLQVLLAIALGAAVGIFFPHTADDLLPTNLSRKAKQRKKLG